MEVLGEGEVGAQNSVPSTAHPKQQSLTALRFHVPLFLSSTNSTNLILPLKLLISFFLVNLGGNVKKH